MKYIRKMAGIIIALAFVAGGCGRTARVDDWPANQRIEVQSEMLNAVQYDSAGNVLTVEMDDGTKQVHYGVSEKIYKMFMTSAAKGGFYEQNIKKVYPATESIKWQGINMIPVQSTVFDAAYYDQYNSVLSLMQEGGTVEQFVDVPQEIYEGFMDASIKGSYFSGYIRDYYTKPESVMVPLPPPPEEATPEPVVVKDVKPVEAETTDISKLPAGPIDPNAPMGVKSKKPAADIKQPVVAKPAPKKPDMKKPEKPVEVAKPKKPKPEVAPVKELQSTGEDELDALLQEFNVEGPAKKDTPKAEMPKKPVKKPEKNADPKPAPEKTEAPVEPKAAPAKEMPAKSDPLQDDLDALLNGLDEPTPAPKKEAPAPEGQKALAKEMPATAADPVDDLDALLNSLDEPAPAKKEAVKPEPAPKAAAPAAPAPEDDLDALLNAIDDSAKKAENKVSEAANQVKEVAEMPKKPAAPKAPALDVGGDDELDALLNSIEESSSKSDVAVKKAADEVNSVDVPKPAKPVTPAPPASDADLDDLLKSIENSADKADDKVKDAAKGVEKTKDAAAAGDEDLDALLKELESGN